ncbi:putative ribonuclease VapC4 [groundwater metagenome]|uniref:Putative ribonuclease VapC4 n=1 Tax=groundwater metagenome TaxID=717931 RepID=A0A098EEE8_9ZZZZ
MCCVLCFFTYFIMKKVIIDTNFLLIPEKFHLDIFYEISLLVPGCEFIVMDGTFRELEGIKKDRNAANISLKILEKFKDKYTVYESNKDKNYKTVDEEILDVANDNSFIVCTDDKDLKRKLKEIDVGTITLKHKSRIDFG